MNLVTLDFETFYDKEYSLSNMTTSEYILDPRFCVLGLGVKVNDKPAVWIEGEKVEAFFHTYHDRIKASIVLMHHAHFDGAIMQWRYGTSPYLYLDTLCIGRALHGVQVGGSLSALLRHYKLGEKAPLSPDSSREEIKRRGIVDVERTFQLYKHMGLGFPIKEIKLIDKTIRMFTDPTFVGDRHMLQQLVNKLAKEKEQLLEEAGVTKELVMSSAKMADILENLGVDPPMKANKKGKLIYAFAKSDRAFQELLDHEHPLVQAVVSARLGVKSTGDETRARRYLEMAQHGALPVYLQYYAAHTGRWGGGDKTNFQNLRRSGVLRNALQAPEGHVLVVGDLAQIEARITFWMAQQENALEAFRNGRDIYCEFGQQIYGRTITKSDVTERFVSKTGVLGLGFGCGVDRFRAEIRAKGNREIGQQLAQKVVDTFRKHEYPKVPMLWAQVETLLTGSRTIGPIRSENNRILLPNGLALEYPELKRSGGKWRYKSKIGWKTLWGGAILENIVQALARIILGDMILMLGMYKIVTLTHDEIVICVPEEKAAQAKLAMEYVMSQTQDWYADLPVACEIGIGVNYGATK